MANKNAINIWNLFRQEFSDGDRVIVIHEDCKLYCGKLTAYEKYCLIGSQEFPWSEIVFIAHDGFPCKALDTYLSDEQLDEIENTESVILMRKMLSKQPDEKLITEKSTPKVRYHSAWAGCPFEFREVYLQILNPFMVSSRFATSINNCEEILLCKSKDGAVGMLWEIDNEIIEYYV